MGGQARGILSPLRLPVSPRPLEGEELAAWLCRRNLLPGYLRAPAVEPGIPQCHALGAELAMPSVGRAGPLEVFRPEQREGIRRASAADAPEAVHGEHRVLDLGRTFEAMADELTPFLEIGRAAEIDGVVLERLPADKETVSRWLLDGALQLM